VLRTPVASFVRITVAPGTASSNSSSTLPKTCACGAWPYNQPPPDAIASIGANKIVFKLRLSTGIFLLAIKITKTLTRNYEQPAIVKFGNEYSCGPRGDAKLRNSDVGLTVSNYQAWIITSTLGDIQKLLTTTFDAGRQH
jgi:hypothetical protein